ncbi:hypothetical protein NDA07_01485 [Microcoleus vaginatus DQ-U2]|uniref:hypothetical protein n=1 Tax=Microcoleus vaginatus TaxID=119532 RepID=UPI001686456E|nr:hypothetical protein [Microcoleus sp. FACHB-DQ6]
MNFLARFFENRIFFKGIRRLRAQLEAINPSKNDSSRDVDSWFKHDPIEDDPKFKSIIEAAEREAEAELANEPEVLGYCHQFWSTKTRILKEKYGVDWKSPAEMNPDVLFD